MTQQTIISRDSGKQYRLTLDDDGQAIDCDCPDHVKWCPGRPGGCKHMQRHNLRRHDEARTAYLNVAISLGWE